MTSLAHHMKVLLLPCYKIPPVAKWWLIIVFVLSELHVVPLPTTVSQYAYVVNDLCM